mgnify:FL=1
MYKIYINDHPFYLLKYEEADAFRSDGYDVFPYMGNVTVLLNFIDQLEKSDKKQKMALYAEDFQRLKTDFTSLYRKIGAMGGIVTNQAGEVLFIYRRGKWDLPKGKKEKGESKKECAVREVMEETGLENLNIQSKVGKTRHTYRDPRSGERILKTTHWYEMKASDPGELNLQTEEDIVDAKWMSVESFLAGNYITFGNIIDILNAYRSKIGLMK